MGRLEITVVDGEDLKQTEGFLQGKQDPYFVILIGDERWRGRTINDGGRNPRFGESKVIDLFEDVHHGELQIWNKNMLTRDEFIGGAHFSVARAKYQGSDELMVPLEDEDNRPAGAIRMVLRWEGDRMGDYEEGRHYGPPRDMPYRRREFDRFWGDDEY